MSSFKLGSLSSMGRSKTNEFSSSNGNDNTISFPRSGSLPYTNSKLKSDAISGIIMSTAVIPNYHPRNSIEDLQVQTTTPILKDLLRRKQIKVASRQRFAKDIDLLNSKKSLILIHVVPYQIMNNDKFQFTFHLLFGPYHNVSADMDDDEEENKYNDIQDEDEPNLQRQQPSIINNAFDAFDTSKFSKVYYYYELNVSRSQLKLIHDTTVKEMSESKEYFARKKYPSPHKQTLTKRSKRINNEMIEENKYLLLPNFPKGKSLFHKKASWEDCENYALYLEKLFSSSPLCVQDYIFDTLLIDPKLKKLIQHKAGTRLRTLRNIANQEFLKNPYKLTRKKGPDYNFHTLYITQRPLRITNSNFSPVNFDHWALKFEGNKNLLTVEFFDEAESDHGIVKIRIIPNTRLNRRVWWYWWEQDPDIDHGIDGQKRLKPKPQYFTRRWETIWKVWLKCITAECIGRLIMKWLQTNDYAIYQVAKNNCQHFVRDITASLDISAAKKLNSLFDHKVIASVLPAVAVADGMTEEVRMYEIRDVLITEINNYNTKKRKQKNKRHQHQHHHQYQTHSKPYPINQQRQVSHKKSRAFSPRRDAYAPKNSPPPISPLNGDRNRDRIKVRPRQRSSGIYNDDRREIQKIMNGNNLIQEEQDDNNDNDDDDEKIALLPNDPKYDTSGTGEQFDENRTKMMSNYKEEIEVKRQSTQSTNFAPDLDQIIQMNGLNVDNFNALDSFFVEEDKSRMIEQIDSNDCDQKWNQHLQIVKDYINSPKNMDPEQILNEIRSPQNTNLMIKLNQSNLSNIDMFIPLLRVIYKNFSLDDDDSDDEETFNNDIHQQLIINDTNMNDININDNKQDSDDSNNSEKGDEKSDDEKYNMKSEASIEDYHHEEEDDDNASFQYFADINKRSDYDKLICDGSCGNTLSIYIYSIKQSMNCNSKNKSTLGADDKLSTIARCFISYDYELRIELISLIEKHYYLQNNSAHNIIIDEMLNSLKNEDECFEIDKENENDALKWVKKFDLLFQEFIKTNKSFILDQLSLKGCRRAHNLSIIEEFQQNSSKLTIQLKTNIFPIKKSLIYKTLNQNGKELKTNELIALYAFIKYQNEFFKEKINSCKWKQFYTNLTSAIKKIHDGLSIESTKFPPKLYCYTNQLQKDKDTLTLNSITYWNTNKSSKRLSGGTLLELNDVKEFLFHHNKDKCSIIGVPVHWIIDIDNNDNNDNIDQWMLMPFVASSTDRMEKKGYEALFNIDKNNTNSFIIMNSKYWG